MVLRPHLSVCVAAYKESNTLPRIVDNIFRSTLWKDAELTGRPRELLICVNGQDAPTEEVAQRLASEHLEIRVIFLAKKGKTDAWLRLIGEASCDAENIFFVDADIATDDDTFERLERHLADRPDIDCAGADSVAITNPGCGRYSLYQRWRAWALNDAETAGLRHRIGFVCGACYAIRRRAALFVRSEVPEGCLDDDKILNAILYGRTCVVPGACVYYKVPSLRESFRVRVRHWMASRWLRINTPELYAKLFGNKRVWSERFASLARRPFLSQLYTVTDRAIGLLCYPLYLWALWRHWEVWPSVRSTKDYLASAVPAHHPRPAGH